ncbi:MAG: hypothetical protein JSS60_05425 [Verrucomicrobia bacterium]|nr:hypothetical protein [Verrucomicrobiota bacterium]
MSSIPPSGGSGESTFGGVPPAQQAQQDLDNIQEVALQLQQSIQADNSATQIQNLVEELQKATKALQEVSSGNPSALSPSQNQLINNVAGQAQNLGQNPDGVSPADLAMLQGTCTTASQMLSAPASAQINVDALQASNQLTSLANTLSDHLKTPGSHAHHELVGNMGEPASTLNSQLQSGGLNSDQATLTTTVLENVSTLMNAPTSKAPAPETVQQLQTTVTQLSQSFLD